MRGVNLKRFIFHSVILNFLLALFFSSMAFGQETCPASNGCSAAASAQNSSNFNGTQIPGGDYIWFNSIVKVDGRGSNPAAVHFSGAKISFVSGPNNYELSVPDADIVFSASSVSAKTEFIGCKWVTTVPLSYTGNVFLSGLAYPVPAGGLPGGINPVSWSGSFITQSSGISVQWKWAAAVYNQFTADYTLVGAKPIDGSQSNDYANSDHAGTPEYFKTYVTGGARGGGGSNYTGSYSGTLSVTPTADNGPPVLSISTPDGSWTKNQTFDISGTATDDLCIRELTVGGTLTSLNPDGTFSTGITLLDGLNTVEIAASDHAGNRVSNVISIHLDREAPALTVTDPPDDLSTNNSLILIKGEASDNGAFSLSVSSDGTAFSPPVVDGRFEQPLTFSAEKTYVLTVNATDLAGNESSVIRNITYDVTPPTVTIDAVVSPTNSGEQAITGTMEKGSTVKAQCVTAQIGPVSYPTETTWKAFVSGMSQGDNAFTATATDQAGNVSAPASTHILLDSIAPTGSIAINSGALYTNNAVVDLTLAATDANGVVLMKLSNDGITWTDPEPYAAAKTWTLEPVDGLKGVQVMFGDAAGNWSAPASSSITLDTVPPAGTVVINSGAAFTNSTTVSLSISASDSGSGISQMCVGNILSCTVWEEYLAEKSWVLTSGDENKVVYVWFKDVAGNITPDPVTASIVLDTTPPLVVIESPADRLNTKERAQTISGTVTHDPPLSSVSINGIDVALVSGRFELQYTLQEGANPITARASDQARNEGSASITVTLDSVAPAPPQLNPAPAATNQTSITISGSAEPGSAVIITNGPQTFADPAGAFSVVLTLSPDTVNTFNIKAVDAVGNESLPVPFSITQDSLAPTVLSYSLQADPKITLMIPISIIFSEEINPATVNSQSITIIGQTGTVAGSFSLSGAEAIFTPSAEFPANETFTLTVGPDVKDKAGNALSPVFTATFDTIRGPSFVLGEVYDDTIGLPLAGAEAKIVSINGAAPAQTLSSVSDGMGRFSIHYEGASGEAIVEITKPGFSKAVRAVYLWPNKSVTIWDARLSPLKAYTVSFSSGADIQLGENILSFAASSFGKDEEISVASVSQQGFELKLPLGWSPVFGIDISPADLALSRPAALRIKNIWSFTAAGEVVAAYLNPDIMAWVSADITLSPQTIEIKVDRLGQYYLIVPDSVPAVPPLPLTTGEAIQASFDSPPNSGIAAVKVVPPAILSGSGDRGLTGVVVTTSQPAPSGTAIQARITEKYTLSGGAVEIPESFNQDIALYAQPDDGNDNTLSASFPTTPSRTYSLGGLYYGKVNIDILLPEAGQPTENIIGNAGGTVTGPDGAGIIIPPSSLTADAVFVVSPLSAADLPGIGSGVTFAGGLVLRMEGGSFKQGAAPQFIIPGLSLPEGTKVIIAKIETMAGKDALTAVGTGTVASGKITFAGCLSAASSCISSGRYAFFVPSGPFGFISGEVLKTGAPASGVIVSVDNLPFKGMTYGNGQFTVLSLSGSYTVNALDGATGQAASDSGTIADGETKNILLNLVAVNTVVTSVVPADKSTGVDLSTRITVTFSGPVDPVTVNAASFVISESGFPNTLTPISGRISFYQGKTVVFIPDASLKSNTFYHVKITPDVKDSSANPVVAFESVFTTAEVLENEALPPGKLNASMPDADGNVTVRGGVGLTYGGARVLIINKTKNIVNTIFAAQDGSFEGKVKADLPDEIVVQVLDLLGNTTTLSTGLMQNPDGTAAVGPKGGTIYGPGGVKAMIPEGAFENTIALNVRIGTEDDLKDVSMSSDMVTAGVFHLNTNGVEAKKELKISIPAPDWITPEHQILIGPVINFRGFNELTLACPAVLKESDAGRTIESTSPPFTGVTGGIYTTYSVRTWADPADGVGYALVETWTPYASAGGTIQSASLASGYRGAQSWTPGELYITGIGGYVFPLPPHYVSDLARFPITVPVNRPYDIVLSDLSGGTGDKVSIQGPPARGEFVQGVIKITNDKVPPTVVTNSIPSGATGVLVGENITIEMSEPIDPQTVNCNPQCGTVTVTDAQGAIVKGSTYLAADGKTLVFMPEYGFSYGTDYTVKINGVIDLGGNTLQDYTTGFTTFEPNTLSTTGGISYVSAMDKYTSSVDGRDYLLMTGAYGTEESGLIVVDISDPLNPIVKGVTHTMGSDDGVKALPNITLTDAKGNTFSGDFAVTVGGTENAGYLNIVNVTDPANPHIFNYFYIAYNPDNGCPSSSENIPCQSGTPSGVDLLDTYAYVANEGIGIQVVDITAPLQKDAIVMTYADPASDQQSYRGIATIKGKQLVLASGNGGLSVFDGQLNPQGKISGLNYPWDVTGVEAFPIDLDGDGNLGTFEDEDGDAMTSEKESFDLAFVSTHDGLAVIDVSSGKPCKMDLIRTNGVMPASPVVDKQRRIAYAAFRGKLGVISLKDLRPSPSCTFPAIKDANGDGIDDRVLTGQVNYSGFNLVLNEQGTMGYLMGQNLLQVLDLGRAVKNSDGQPFIVDRTYYLSQFDASPGPLALDYTDSFKIFDFNLDEQSSVSIKLLDPDRVERSTLFTGDSIAAGAYKFVVDYKTITAAGFDPLSSPKFYVEVKTEGPQGSTKVLYQGKLAARTEGKMLGQTIVHDVLIQDGSLNLSRQDLELKGRGPQLSFIRSYNNQGSRGGHLPLGEGWSHNLDMKMYPISADEYVNDSVPDWVTKLKGKLFTENDLPKTPSSWTILSVNGTVFKKQSGIWFAERGRHGTLQASNDGMVYTSKDGTQYKYNYPITGPTPVKEIVDRNGNKLTIAYDNRDLPMTVTDAANRQLIFTYTQKPAVFGDDGVRLEKVTGPDGIELTFEYDGNGYLAKAVRDARTEIYNYSLESSAGVPEYNLAGAKDSNGHSYAYEYYKPGEVDPGMGQFVKVLKSEDIVKKVTYPDGAFASFVYDVTSGNKRIVTDLRGYDATYTLNYYGNPLKIEEPLGKTTFMTWSIDENKADDVMTSKTDANGNTTTYEYDLMGNITKETDANNKSITTTWDTKFSQPLSRTDRNAVNQTWQYDPKGNLFAHMDGDRKSTSYTYYPTGERQTMTDPRGKVTSYTYDAQGNPDKVTGPEGSITDYDYDVRGRLVSVKDPNANKTIHTYDELDYPRTITYQPISLYALPPTSSNVQTFNYDAVGNLMSETNRNGLTLTYTYTPRNQVESVSRSAGGKKDYSYDENGNLLSETDWSGNKTEHAYDPLNRRSSTTNRLGYMMSMAYDLNGNLTSSTDYEGKTTAYVYDKLNRLTDATQPEPDGGIIHNTYYSEADLKTNLKTVTDQEGNTTTYEYNGRYLRSKQTDALAGVHTWEYDDSGNLSKETDEETKYTDYAYDGQNRRILMTRMGGVTTGYQYDANGNLTHVIDPLGRDTETQYDEWNRAWKVIDADKYENVTEYDGEGNKIRTVDGNNNVRTWVRDSRGLVLSETDAEGNTTSHTYDLNGNVLTSTDPRGTVTKTTYDLEDRPIETKEAFGQPEERTKSVVLRDKMGNPLQVKDYNGNVTRTEYNSIYLPAKVYDPNGKVTSTTYYKTGKVKSVTDRRGFATTHDYDALNREIRTTDPKLLTIETTYDKVGNVKTVKDKRGIIKENTYDDLYRLVETKRAGIRLVTNTYDAAGNIIAAKDANGNITGHEYNNRNLLKTTTFPDTTTETRTYDGNRNLLTVTDEELKTTTYTYDKENRQTSAEFAGEKTEKTYDELGDLATIKRPEGNIRKMEYDRFRRLITVVDDFGGLNLTTRFEYDANGNQRHQYDARNNHVEMKYDSLNRKIEHTQIKASGSLTTYFSYDEEGNMTGMTDAKGQNFTYFYDELNRQTRAVYPDATTPYYSIGEIQTGYDGNNNITSIVETKKDTASATITDSTSNIYDNFDRLTSSTERGLAVTYTYDNNGNRLSVATPSASTSYTYDGRNRVKTATSGLQTTSYTYYPDGKKDTISYPNGASIKYTYFPTNRIQSITNKAGASVISSYDYQYDKNGNRTSQIEVQNGASETTTYNYDAADRMKDFTVTGADTTTTEYTFDGYNRKTEKVTTNGTVTKDQTYTYDESDWITKIDDNLQQSAVSYEYDSNGNMIQKSDSTLPNGDMYFAYDSRNKMVEAKRGPPGSQTVLGLYDYNSAGFRVRHRLSERGDVDYYYDHESVIEERNSGDNTLLAHYQYGDHLIALSTSTGNQYYHYDALGSTVNLTTDSGNVQVSYKLDPWGHIRLKLGESLNRHIFTGQETDENTGLIYFGARYYEPDTARFMTQDTYLGEADTPPSLNRYLYAYSNPTVYVDLLGYYTWKEFKEDAKRTLSGFKEAYRSTKEAVVKTTEALSVIGRKTAEALPIISRESAKLPEAIAERYTPETPAGSALSTLLYTAGKFEQNCFTAPLTLLGQVGTFASDRKLKNVPIAGPAITHAKETTEAFIDNPSLLTGSQVFGAYSDITLLIAGGAELATVKRGAASAITEESAALTKEAHSARVDLKYDISRWGEYGLPSDGYFSRTITAEQYRALKAGRNFEFGGRPTEDYPKGMGFIGSAEETRGLTTVSGYREALKLDYDPKYVLDFQLRNPAGLQNVTSAPYPEFVYGGKTGAGFSEWNYPGISSNDIINPEVRLLK